MFSEITMTPEYFLENIQKETHEVLEAAAQYHHCPHPEDFYIKASLEIEDVNEDTITESIHDSYDIHSDI